MYWQGGATGYLIMARNYGFGYANDDGQGGYGYGARNEDGYSTTEETTTGIGMTRTEAIASMEMTTTTITTAKKPYLGSRGGCHTAGLG